MVVVDNAIQIPLPVSGFLQAEQSHALTLSSASSCCKRLLAGKLLASAPVSVSQSVESIVMCLFLKTWHAVMASCFWIAMPAGVKLNATTLHGRKLLLSDHGTVSYLLQPNKSSRQVRSESMRVRQAAATGAQLVLGDGLSQPLGQLSRSITWHRAE